MADDGWPIADGILYCTITDDVNGKDDSQETEFINNKT